MNNFLTRAEVLAMFSISHETLRRWLKHSSLDFNPDFPQPLRIGHRLLWDFAEMQAYLVTEKAKRDKALAYKQEIRNLKQEVKESFLAQQKIKTAGYIRPPKGERLSAHTLRKLQAYRLQ